MEKQSYEDIIQLKRPESLRPRASMEDRAAQFSAFEALTGHEEAVAETARLTDEKPILSESMKQILDERWGVLRQKGGEPVQVYLQYFEKDLLKAGGCIKEVVDFVRKIDEFEKLIYLQNGQMIRITDILDLEIYFEEQIH